MLFFELFPARLGCYNSDAMLNALNHIAHVFGTPRPLKLSPLFRGPAGASTYQSNVSEQLQQIAAQLNSQSSTLRQLTLAVTGKSGVQDLFGGSILGGVASAVSRGFSWQSVLKDVFPVGGLISGIAGLFSSTPTPAPLPQYDAPPSLSFEAVLGADGRLSQSSGNQYGHVRASSSGFDLIDAAGGPYSPYQRAQNGSLVATAGDPATRYQGTLNLPEMLQSIAMPGAAARSAPGASILTAGSAVGPAPVSPSSPVLADSEARNVPAFDREWFDDHGSLIASAVRNQLLNFHPIVDAINDL